MQTITNEVLTNVNQSCLIGFMKKDIKQIRLENLHLLLNSRFKGNKAALARALKKDKNQTRFILHPEKSGGRNIGEKQAREIEKELGLDYGWLDSEQIEENNDIQSESEPPPTERQKALWALFEALPSTEQDKLFRELEEKERYFNEIYEELKSKKAG